MKPRTAHAGHNLSPGQIALLALLGLTVVGVALLIGRAYLDSRSASANFGQSGRVTASLANIQREALRLQIETDALLRDPGSDLKSI